MTMISLTARASQEAQATDEIMAVLAKITHPDYPDVIRLTSDPTERLSVEPELAYGTKSPWQTDDPDATPFKFVMMAVDLPDETDEGGGQATLVLDIGNTAIAEVLTGTTKRGTVDLAVVMISSPDVVEWETRDLKIMSAQGDGDSVSLSFAKEDILSELNPGPRMTKQRMPGMHP